MLGWVLEAVGGLATSSTVVVLGHDAETVEALLPRGVDTVIQSEQLGTGHAAQIGVGALSGVQSNDVVVVLCGDTPMLTPELIEDLSSLEDEEVGRVVTAILDDPTGYGRVVRDADGSVVEVVEDHDCSEEQKLITEINAGMYAIRSGALADALAQVNNDNAQAEYYLTDVIGALASGGQQLTAVVSSAEVVAGVNDLRQLADAAVTLRDRINNELMESGVWMQDPDRTYVDASVEIAPGARIYAGVHLVGETRIGPGARVGPEVFIVDSSVGSEAMIWYSVVRSSKIGDSCEVGPYASLRPGTTLQPGSKLGTFVETKNTTLGPGAKASHLSYLGDATVGARSNIGAGAVTVNYDGVDKYPTEIGEDVLVGSDTMLVAPVRLGDRSSTGAGSVITRDVSDDALAIERSGQEEIPGYSRRRAARKAAKKSKD